MTNHTTLGQHIIEHITRVIEAKNKQDRIIDEYAKHLKKKGYRIVSGGQTGPPDPHGRSLFEVRDAETLEVLLRNTGTYKEYTELWNQHSNGTWYHTDGLLDESSYQDIEIPYDHPHLPTTLAQALTDWATDNPTDAQQLLNPQDQQQTTHTPPQH